jgi:plasmid stabilization system protein ParE
MTKLNSSEQHTDIYSIYDIYNANQAPDAVQAVRTRADELNEMLGAALAEIGNLRIALETNRRISMAIGILMARRRIAEGEAFDCLRAASQRTHRKLRDVAEDVIYTGDIESPDSASGGSR